MEKPEYLYHYTSIEGLAHILESRQIRFSRLDLLDDLTEGQSQDAVDWRKFFFVSCWTSDEEESIPLWNLYTPDMRGVRIKLPTDFFKKFFIDPAEVPSFIHLADTSAAPKGASISFQSYLPYNRIHGEDYFIMPPSFQKDRWPFPIEYTSDENLLNQNLVSYNEEIDQTILSPFEVAKYKKLVWSFQKEWRFRLYCHPAAPRSLNGSLSDDDYMALMLKALGNLTRGVDHEYFFMDIDDLAFGSMEITLGPKVMPAHQIIVEALAKAYCPKANVQVSGLAGSIN